MAEVRASSSDLFSNIPIDDFSKSTQHYPHHGQQQSHAPVAQYSHAQHQHQHPHGQPQQQQQQQQQQQGGYPAAYVNQNSTVNNGASGQAASSFPGQMIAQIQTQNPHALNQTLIQTHAQAQAQAQTQTTYADLTHYPCNPPVEIERLSQDMTQMALVQQQYQNVAPQQHQQQQMVQVQQQQQQYQQQQQHHHHNVIPRQLQYDTVQRQQQVVPVNLPHLQQHEQHQQHQRQGQQQPRDQPSTNVIQQQQQGQDPHNLNTTFASDLNLQCYSTLTSSLTSEASKIAADQNYPWNVDDVSSIESPSINHNEQPRNTTKQPSATSPSTLITTTSDSDDHDSPNNNNNNTHQRRHTPHHPSSRSYTSESSFVAHYTLSPLDKPTFAPPPAHPGSMEIMPHGKIPPLLRQSNTSSTTSTGPSALPSYSQITHSGHVSARLSPKSLIMKKWKRVFWVTYGETTVLVFRSRADFEEWVSNPYMSEKEREELVKLRVEFKRSELDNLGVRCYRASALHSKDYGKSGTMCTFKLEQWMHHGPVVIGAFASSSKPEVGSFQVICNAMIERQKYGVKHLIADSRDEIADSLLMTLNSERSYCNSERS